VHRLSCVPAKEKARRSGPFLIKEEGRKEPAFPREQFELLRFGRRNARWETNNP